MRISKAALLQGTSKTREFRLSPDEFVVLRPLNSEQYAEVEALAVRGIKLDGKAGNKTSSEAVNLAEMDISRIMTGQREAERLAVKFSLVEQEGETPWTLEDVGKLPTRTVERIAKEVFLMSGLGKGVVQAAESFRKK